MENHKIEITIRNLHTADNFTLETTSEVLRNKKNKFFKDIFDDMLLQVLDNVNRRQELKDKNELFTKDNG